MGKTETRLEGVDFRVLFKQLDDAALMNAEEYAALIGVPSRASIFHLLTTAPTALAAPAIRRPRLVRWRVGDVRDHLRGLAVQEPREARRGGRPRKVKADGPQ